MTQGGFGTRVDLEGEGRECLGNYGRVCVWELFLVCVNGHGIVFFFVGWRVVDCLVFVGLFSLAIMGVIVSLIVVLWAVGCGDILTVIEHCCCCLPVGLCVWIFLYRQFTIVRGFGLSSSFLLCLFFRPPRHVDMQALGGQTGENTLGRHH